MDSRHAALMKSLDAELRLARENPYTDWVLSFLNWTTLLVFILCLTPCVLSIRRTGRLASGIGASWAGLLIFFIWWGVIAHLIAVKWTGDRHVMHNFPEAPTVFGYAIGGWAPLLFLSFIQELLLAISRWILHPLSSWLFGRSRR